MDKTIETLVRIANREFNGASFMGPAFLPCIKAFDLDTVKKTDTFEGYSVWQIALHVLYHKFAAIQHIGGASAIPKYQYEEVDWPKPKAPMDGVAWNRLIEELESMHQAWIAALTVFPMSRYNEIVPAWNCTIGQILEFVACHDMYHAAQIRNMGLKPAT